MISKSIIIKSRIYSESYGVRREGEARRDAIDLGGETRRIKTIKKNITPKRNEKRKIMKTDRRISRILSRMGSLGQELVDLFRLCERRQDQLRAENFIPKSRGDAVAKVIISKMMGEMILLETFVMSRKTVDLKKDTS